MVVKKSSWDKRNKSSDVRELIQPLGRKLCNKCGKCKFFGDNTCYCTLSNGKADRPSLFSMPGKAQIHIGADSKSTNGNKKDPSAAICSGECKKDSRRVVKSTRDDPIRASECNKDSSDSPKSDQLLRRVKDFRSSHFFDTHSTEDLLKNKDDHQCVHQFEIDDRFLPKPINTDVYGTSRCISCDKPMSFNGAQTQTAVDKTTLCCSDYSRTSPRDQLRNRLANTARTWDSGPAPRARQVIVGGGDVRIEIVGFDPSLGQVKMGGKKMEVKKCRPNYCNTYALRYQRGVV